MYPLSRWLYVCLVAALFIGLVAIADVSLMRKEKSDLVAQLSLIGEKTLGGQSIERSSLSELRIEWFRQANILDPLFAIDGTDPAALRESISYLVKERDTFASRYPATERKYLEESMYPVDFLSHLADLQDKRNAFLQTPSARTAESYQEALIKTIHSYVTDADSFKRALDSVTIPETYLFIAGRTTPQTVSRAVAALITQTSGQEQKARTRYGCFLYFSKRCPDLHDLSIKRIEMMTNSRESLAVGSDTMRSDRVLTRYFNSDPEYVGGLNGPALVIGESCYPYDTALVRSWLIKPKESTGYALHSGMINDGYIHVFTATTTWPVFYSDAYRRGARLEAQVSGNFYLCPNPAHDIHRILSFNALMSGVRVPLFRNATSSEKIIERISLQETRLTQSKFISDTDAASYMRDAEFALHTLGRDQIRMIIGSDALYRFDKLANEWYESSAQLDQVVREIAYESTFLGIGYNPPETRMSVRDIFLSRSASSILFLSQNRSVAPVTVTFALDTQRSPLQALQTISLLQALKYSSDDNVLQELKKTRSMLEPLRP